ncbi:WS/DGAT/MGAT family O-acyltransferase [Nocardia australiensis]|uniref:WS/DGAT/MGAT family O-acyltransferase n=1 Tax=Nocardia australiensis TaxID=2887191 RepID=UPI001D137196|nr:wax ester/triacylglycerol synthase family O-acyltransferase [Nocardia australiensis]
MTTVDTPLQQRRYLTVRTSTPGEHLTAAPDTSGASRQMIPMSDGAEQPRQLSALDTQLLNAESPSMPLHVGAVTVLKAGDAGTELTISRLRELIASRLHLTPPLRWRLRTVPLGLDLPYWEDCTAIDLGYHVRAQQLPEDATDQQLADLVARLHATPLDRARPLWQCHLISGLADGRQALHTKVHHSLIDGVSGAEVMVAILDAADRPQPIPPPTQGFRVTGTASTLGMLGRAIPHAALRHADRLRAPFQLGPALGTTLAKLRKTNPSVPFNGPNTADRCFAFVSLSLDEVKTVKNSFGGTVNDVVMTLCTSALRRWLIEHDAEPDRPLLAAVPVSVRAPEQFGTAGNQFSIMLAELPVDEPDPAQRMKRQHTILLDAKAHFGATPPTVLHQSASTLPQLLHGATTRALLRLGAPTLPLANIIISNVPGPQIPLYAAGIRAIASYPIALLTDLSGGLNITVMSYDGHIDFGILACPDSVPDVWRIADYLKDALRELRTH